MAGHNGGSHILCMGSVNMDLTMFMERMPSPGETVVTDNFETFPGGKGGNQAVAASRLGGDVRMFAKLGDDDFSEQLLETLKKDGVDVSAVMQVPGQTAGIAMIRIDQQGINSISFTPGANALMTPEDVWRNETLFEENGFLLITAEFPLETVQAAVLTAKRRNMTVVLDPSPIPKEGFPKELLRMIDYAKPNEIEAAQMARVKVTDRQSAECCLFVLNRMGLSCPIISLGKEGSIAFDGGKPVLFEAMRVESIDSTAAGDVFLGAFTAALARRQAVGEAIRFAGAAAALSTTVKGAQTSIPALREVQAFMEKTGGKEGKM